MQDIILITHVVFGLLFVFTVLVQEKGTGGFGEALGGVGGGGGGFYASQRGAAKVLHYAAVMFAVIFVLTALLYVIVPVDSDVITDENTGLSISDVENEVDLGSLNVTEE